MGCGKVILFGEHAVVHGQPALAAALEIGVTATVAIDAAARGLRLEVPIWGTATSPGDGTRMGEAFAAIAACVERSCVEPLPGVTVTLDVKVPVGAGLGSSAALAVAVARALFGVARLPSGVSLQALVLEAAEASERVFHGNPSGVDHTTSALGGIIRFERGVSPMFQPVRAEPLPIIVAQMEPGADTGAMVASVQARLDDEPKAVGALLVWMGELTRAADAALRRGDLARLGRLMDLAHGALVGLGVSTPALDAGCHLARRAGAYGAKLTGAGGGGCLIAVAPGGRQAQVAEALSEAGALVVLETRAGVQRVLA